MIRFACLGAFLVAFALTGPAWATGGCGIGCRTTSEGACVAMGGRKVCPFGTCARPHPGQLPLADHITDGARNPSCAYRVEQPEIPALLGKASPSENEKTRQAAQSARR
jgi:hypothetical protein